MSRRWNPRSMILSLSLLGAAASSGCAPAATDDDAAPEGPGRKSAVLSQAAQRSVEIFARRAGFLLGRGREDLQVARAHVDDLSLTHTRLQQTYGGVPVFGGEAIVHLRQDGEATLTDNALRDVSAPTTPVLDRARAAELAVAHHGCSKCLTAAPQTDLWVLRHEGRDRLVYRVQLRQEDGTARTSMPVIFIDAQSGEKVWSYDNLQTGTGSSLYSGTVAIGTSSVGSTYYMEDLGKKIGTFDFRNTTSSVYRFSDADDTWNSTSQRAGVDAHYGAAAVFDYYQAVHGRNGIDGSGGPGGYAAAASSATRLISSRVHYGSNYNNAYWNGTYMTYGDGDGSFFSPLVTLDIAGHEMTHGVTQYTAGLVYSGESGALNESMSDVFGAMVERRVRGESAATWKIGEECFTPANGTGDALRYMDNTHAASNGGYTADDDPDHYSERYTGTADNGGVHINSGIANHAFYLLAKGGTHHLSGVAVTGIGADAAAGIWYRALTTYMTSSTNFAGARTATLSAAADLHGAGSAQYEAVSRAWCACGVGTCDGGPPPGGDLLTNGGFEASVSPWVLSGSGAFYTANGSSPHGGTGYIYLGQNRNASGQAYQQISIPAGASTANLTFWLNVTSSETTTTAQRDRLFIEVRSTSGALLRTLATYSNLDKGTVGAYSQKGSFSLLDYRGQTVRVQFRATNNNNAQTTTFRVDDASVQ